MYLCHAKLIIFLGSVYFDVMHYGRYGRLWTHSTETIIRETGLEYM